MGKIDNIILIFNNNKKDTHVLFELELHFLAGESRQSAPLAIKLSSLPACIVFEKTVFAACIRLLGETGAASLMIKASTDPATLTSMARPEFDRSESLEEGVIETRGMRHLSSLLA